MIGMKILSEVEVEEEIIGMIEMIEAEDLIEKEAMKKEEADQEAQLLVEKEKKEVEIKKIEEEKDTLLILDLPLVKVKIDS